MYQFLSRKGEMIAFLFGFAIVAIFLILAMTGLPDGFEDMSKEVKFKTGVFDFGLKASMVLVVIGFIIAIGFGLYHMLTNIKGSLKFLGVFGVIVILYFVTAGMADSDLTGPISRTLETFEITEGISKYISGSLTTAIVLCGIALVSLVVFEILNLFK